MNPCGAPTLACSIDTPGVIKRVSELFKGNNTLILGFNTFLPPGYKIELVAAPTLPPAPPMAPADAGHGGGQGMTQGPPPGAGGPQAGPLEFDHAINCECRLLSAAGLTLRRRTCSCAPHLQLCHFTRPLRVADVTKIKRRFQYDPGTYKSFLEILHTYQKQQRTIKDVLGATPSTTVDAASPRHAHGHPPSRRPAPVERVSVLFKDHPDLLRDFTYFLPDAVQDTVRCAPSCTARHAADATAAPAPAPHAP